MNNKVLIQKIIDYALLCVFLLFPLSLNISLLSYNDDSHPLLAINISFSDVLIALTFVIWILKILIYKELGIIKYPPREILFFILFGFLSVINTVSVREWLKEFIQIFEYFILLYLLIINNLFFLRIKDIVIGLFSLTSLIVLIAFIQHVIYHSDVYFVRGLFINETVLGVFLCIVTPLIYVELLSTASIAVKIWMMTLLALITIVLLSGSAVVAILLAVFVVSLLYSKKSAWVHIITFVVLGIIYGKIRPDDNKTAFKEYFSLYERGNISDNYYSRLAMLAGSSKTGIFEKSFGDKYLKVSTNFSFDDRKLNIQKGPLYQEMNGKPAVKNRYLEMQASITLLSEFTLSGVGLGNFQDKIGMYYEGFPKVNTAEPEQHNQYLLIASTTGLLGLSGFVWILISAFQNNWKRYKANKKDTFYLGLMGSIIAVSFEGLFSSLLSASLLVPFVLVISFSITDFHHDKNIS